MTVQTHMGNIPQWTQGDRMRKSLHHAGLSVQDMSDYLGVARGTASNWINDRIPPSTQSLRLWAMRTGVDLDWIRYGAEPAPGDGTTLDDRDTGRYPDNVVDLFTRQQVAA